MATDTINETYVELKTRHQNEFSAFPCFFAFSNIQFDKGARKLGLDPNSKNDRKKLCRGPAGMFLLKSDAPKLANLLKRHRNELKAAFATDTLGGPSGFICQAFEYELANHEYPITRDASEALNDLGVTNEMLEKNPAMRRALSLAKKRVLEDACE